MSEHRRVRLYGTWLARDVDTKMGEVNIELTFREEGPMKPAAWSDIPIVGQVRDKTAPYDVQGNVISSDAIRGGTSVEYSFDGDGLIIRYREGKTVRFKRR
jgi:hypothetical protein